jgi:hypothetical protein
LKTSQDRAWGDDSRWNGWEIEVYERDQYVGHPVAVRAQGLEGDDEITVRMRRPPLRGWLEWRRGELAICGLDPHVSEEDVARLWRGARLLYQLGNRLGRPRGATVYSPADAARWKAEADDKYRGQPVTRKTLAAVAGVDPGTVDAWLAKGWISLDED